MAQAESVAYSADMLRTAATEVAKALVDTLREKVRGGYRARLQVTPGWEGLHPTTSELLAAKPEAFRQAVETAVSKRLVSYNPLLWIFHKLFGIPWWSLKWGASNGELPISGVEIELRY